MDVSRQFISDKYKNNIKVMMSWNKLEDVNKRPKRRNNLKINFIADEGTILTL